MVSSDGSFVRKGQSVRRRLTHQEAQERLARYGLNRIKARRRT
ncbi:MAG: cation-transporting P-type ATPase, partial [Betaproteobacteria bacterium]